MIKKFSITVLFIFMITSIVWGQSVWSWQPDATEGIDTWVAGNVPDTNYGTGIYFLVGKGATDNYFVFIKFNGLQDSLIALNVGTITSAYIKFWENDAVVGDPTFFATTVDSNWVEATLTYNNMPPFGDYTADDTVSSADPCSSEVTSIVED
ncbi:unnamed protein product, partial [marine sediment metagenome]